MLSKNREIENVIGQRRDSVPVKHYAKEQD
jgi:hypothetical protein